MTEAKWNACGDPNAMLDALDRNHGASGRKSRLVVCACCREVWPLFEGTDQGETVDLAEQQADGLASTKELRVRHRELVTLLQEHMRWRDDEWEFKMDWAGRLGFGEDPSWTRVETAILAAVRSLADPISTFYLRQVLSLLADTMPESRKNKSRTQCKMRQCNIIRDIFGPLPFREVRIDPAWLAWNDGAVVKLAEAAYEHREMPSGALDNARLGVLADALEEAGCDQEAMLSHLREQGKFHVRGCHVVDLLLNKE